MLSIKSLLSVLLSTYFVTTAQATNSVTAFTTTSTVQAPKYLRQEFYIAPNGSDTNCGSKEQPLATLEGARDAIRALKQTSVLPQGGITIWIGEGTYTLSKTFMLESQDSGTPGSPIVYRACRNAIPILTGGRTITGFVPYKDKILKTDIATQGFRGIYFRQLFLDSKRLPLARYPNADPSNPITGGWAYVDGALVPMYKEVPGEDKHTLHPKAMDLHRWSHPEEGEVFIYPRYNWWNNIVGIKSIDESIQTITLSKDCSYPIRPNDRYFIQNLFEELDSPGEWYLDKTNSILYFYPPLIPGGQNACGPRHQDSCAS